MKDVINNMYSLEGIDGAGKTTQIPLVKASLEQRGLRVAVLKSPNTDLLGQFIRANVRQLDPWIRNQLFMVDIQATIRKEQGRGGILIWNRYIDSFYASNPEMSLKDADELTKDLPRPKKTFLLDLDPEVVFSQRREALDYHSDPKWLKMKMLRYRELLAKNRDRIVRIDAGQTREVVTAEIVKGILSS